MGRLGTEAFTDADVFGIDLKQDLSVEEKALMLGALFLIDYMYFESSGKGNGLFN